MHRAEALINDSNLFVHTATPTPEDDVQAASFDTVLSFLWAKHAYDVCLLFTGSDHRPIKPQYPLKPEAMEGIRLLEAGSIVPCPNSPVRTSIFPVKKANRLPGDLYRI